MDKETTIKKLCSLIHLDIDAIHAYAQAIENITIDEVKNNLHQFQQDHQRHVENLSGLVTRLGGRPPEFRKDFKGQVIEGFTALRSKMGTEQALKAMRTNEKLTNGSYGDALTWDVDESVCAVIRQNAEDERRHLLYIEQAIEDRVWDLKKAA